MRCSRLPCRRPAEWKPVLVVSSAEKEVRIALPVAVCSLHKRRLHAVVTGKSLRRLGDHLARLGVALTSATAKVEFKRIN